MSKVLTHVEEGASPLLLDKVNSLRVCVVTVAAHGIGGMQQHTHDLVRGLLSLGHDVEVICPAGPGLRDDLYGARWSLLACPARSDPWYREVPAAFSSASGRGRFDVVHSESTSALPLALAQVETPIVVKYHGNYVGLARARLRRARERPGSAHREIWALAHLTRRHFARSNAWAFRHVESIVVSNQQLEDTRRSHFIDRERMHVVPNGVDTTQFSPGDAAEARAELGLPDGFLFATLGRLNAEKGFDVAIDAVDLVCRENPEARLLVVGEGEVRADLERRVARLGLGDRVLFTGGQDQVLVPRFLVASDAFLFPTRRDEAGPLVLPQALATGLPVVASRIGGIPEVLEADGRDCPGILVSPDSAIELADAMRRLLSDARLRADLASSARRRAVERYGLDAMVRGTVDVYRAAIASQRRRRLKARKPEGGLTQ